MAATLPVRSSVAVTCKMPLASIRNVTSIFGIPAGIGSMPRSSKRASERQSLASSRSPCSTCMSTTVWPSTEVVRECVERDREPGPLGAGQPDLGGLRGQPQLLHGLGVLAEIDAVARADVVEQPQHDGAIEVVAAEMRVAVGGQHLEDAVVHA